MRLLFCIGSILIRHDVRLVGAVLADDFFHPNHVVPAPELIAAVVEGTGQREAQMFVELPFIILSKKQDLKRKVWK